MKIGIIGWYGHRNFGDERILYCLSRQLADHELFVAGGWGEARANIAQLNACDFVIVGGGGLVLRGVEKHADVIEGIRVPFCCLGISVESNHRDIHPFLDLLRDRAERIIVRDEESARILGICHPKVEVAPDLTYLQPFDVVPTVKEEICGLNLRPWFFWRGELHGRFHRFMVRQSRQIRGFEKFYPLAKWEPTSFHSTLDTHFRDLRPLPFYFEDGKENDATLMGRYFSCVPSDFSELNYGALRYLVGMRYHAVVFAAQSGVPFLSLSYQPKNVSFCREIGLEDLSVDIFSWRTELAGKVTYLKENYSYLRNVLVAHRQDSFEKVQQMMGEFSTRFV